jgi:F-type H+-transporting ATPase subunit epsilon
MEPHKTADSPSQRGAMQCVVVTPEETVLDEPADFVAVTLYDGELGVAPGRAPLVGRLGFGEMRIRQGDATRRYYVDGGFLEVTGNNVTIITARAIPATQLDAAVAEEQLRAAVARKAHSPELMEIRQRLVAQARAQLRIARRGTPHA